MNQVDLAARVKAAAAPTRLFRLTRQQLNDLPRVGMIELERVERVAAPRNLSDFVNHSFSTEGQGLRTGSKNGAERPDWWSPCPWSLSIRSLHSRRESPENSSQAVLNIEALITRIRYRQKKLLTENEHPEK